ncbi:type IV pilus modification PilV family protein [Cryobacterium sp. W22_MBD10_FK3]|uniref:type IV pilus modification PilV family protein n=1 Tax=Cryobacterium sp. W22_MBD10_FK3 TaxID=3240273 RepID=UPI003F90FAF5
MGPKLDELARSVRPQRNAGFGMIEVVISMFLLGLLAVAFLPLLIGSLRVSAANSTLAVAAQLASKQLEEARAQGPVCSAITIPVGSSVVPGPTDSDGVAFEIRRTRDACPTSAASFPTTVSLTVAVWKIGASEASVKAKTRILVTGP